LKYKKRICSGLNEIKRKVFSIDKSLVKLLVAAVDLQENPLEDGSDQRFFQILLKAKQNNIPIVFSCTRNELGLSLYGRKKTEKVRVSVLAVLNYEGYEKVNINFDSVGF